MYLGVPYAFINKVLLTYQKKKKKLCACTKIESIEIGFEEIE
jgi:hypothetical protein